MSPSPPFSSPLVAPRSHSPSSGRLGITGEHRPPPTIPQHQGGIGTGKGFGAGTGAGTGAGAGTGTGTGTGTEPSNGDYLLYLLQAGNQHRVPPQQHGRNEGGRHEQQQQQRPQLFSQSNLGMAVPGIVPGGGENLMATWDPAVAALGPSHSFNHGGMVGGLPLDDRDFQYSSPPSHGGPLASGWGPHHQTLLHPFAGSPPPPLPGASLPLSPSTDFGGQLLGQAPISNRNGLPVSITGGGGHMDFAQRRPVDGNSFEYHGSQLRRLHSGIQTSPNLPLEPRFRGVGGNSERSNHQQHQQFFGDGAELMKLLQISSSKTSGEVASKLKCVDNAAGAGGVGGSPAAGLKMNPAIAHGPIGPPRRSDGMAGPNLADDLLGRFWPAPAASGGNGPVSNLVQKPPPFGVLENSGGNGSASNFVEKPPSFGVVENSAGFLSKGPSRWGEQPSPGPELFDRSVRGSKSFLAPTLVSRDGEDPRFLYKNVWFTGSELLGGGATGLPDNLDLYNGRGLLGNWVGNPEGMGGSAAAAAGGGEQFRKGCFESLNKEGQGIFAKVSEHQSGPGLIPIVHEQLQQPQQQHHRADGLPTKEVERDHHLRDAIGRMEPGRVATGGVRRGTGFRGEPGCRRGGRSLIGQWVAVNDKLKDREGSETGFPSDTGTESSSSEKGCSSATNSIKDEAITVTRVACGPQKGGGRDESKRRKGQQEWRMKSPSCTAPVQHQAQASPVLRSSGFGMDSDSSDTGNGSYRASSLFKMRPLASQVDHPGLPSNVLQDAAAMPGSAIEESKTIYHGLAGNQENGGNDSTGRAVEKEDDDLPDSYDERGIRQAHTPAQEEFETGLRQNSTRELRRFSHRTPVPCKLEMRPDLEEFTSQILEIYVSLIPPEEEIRTRRQFLSHLDNLVSREWPGAMLFLFGSCANAFGVCNSDIDICLSISDDQPSKADSVLKMAAILRSDDMQNVLALTHARVPIVKFTDPATGISCDICVNNKLAVVNSKLLHDYSLIDVRLRQLAFLVKHWAKRRQVNETYRGTLSSYAYVLMCIHFLQQRKPPILPCLQEMPPTYSVTVCDIDCSYYDRVETLQNFGISNKESLGELLTSFFEYWAFRHDYNKSVISVRTGGYLSKDEKEWTRRVGNERHLICIEDPLEVTHDLGRVVDRHSIRVLRDEFHRAAKVLRYDVNPCFALFEHYVRDKP